MPAFDDAGRPDAARRILYVEDEDELRRTVAGVLVAERWEVTTASSAEEGLEALIARPHGLVITDWTLPGNTGGWLLAEARQRGLLDDAGAIVVTGEREVGDVGSALVLRKPVDLDLLVAEAAARLEAVAYARTARSRGKRPVSGVQAQGAEIIDLASRRRRG
ncbi:MAG: response regulator [Polyangiaceae bacterium]